MSWYSLVQGKRVELVREPSVEVAGVGVESSRPVAAACEVVGGRSAASRSSGRRDDLEWSFWESLDVEQA